jgi:hypothetical protein
MSQHGTPKSNTAGKVTICLACLLYVAACVLPCIDGGEPVVDSDPGFPDFEAGPQFGILILLCGYTGGNNGVPWSANVVWALGLLCIWQKRFRPAAALGMVATALGLTTHWARPGDKLLAGYFFWQTSLLMVAVGPLIALRLVATETAAEPTESKMAA